jgi:hypothetical protein
VIIFHFPFITRHCSLGTYFTSVSRDSLMGAGLNV